MCIIQESIYSLCLSSRESIHHHQYLVHIACVHQHLQVICLSFISSIEITSLQRPPPLSHQSTIFIKSSSKISSLHQQSHNVNHLLYYHRGYHQPIINAVKSLLLLDWLTVFNLLLPLHRKRSQDQKRPLPKRLHLLLLLYLHQSNHQQLHLIQKRYRPLKVNSIYLRLQNGHRKG